jgi:hypothetical protein
MFGVPRWKQKCRDVRRKLPSRHKVGRLRLVQKPIQESEDGCLAAIIWPDDNGRGSRERQMHVSVAAKVLYSHANKLNLHGLPPKLVVSL